MVESKHNGGYRTAKTSCLAPVANSVRRPTAKPNITHRPLLISLAFVHPKNLQQRRVGGKTGLMRTPPQRSPCRATSHDNTDGLAQTGRFVSRAADARPTVSTSTAHKLDNTEGHSRYQGTGNQQ